MNNQQKNNYVINQITNTTLNLLKEKELSMVSIKEITDAAQVSRNSFYRNFTNKEDIISKYIQQLLTDWRNEYENSSNNNSKSNAEMYGSLFAHIKDNQTFYLLIKKRNLFHLVLNVFIQLYGAKTEHNNMEAYVTSFITYGTYGWIEEWIARGMQESAETMNALLSSHGMK